MFEYSNQWQNLTHHINSLIPFNFTFSFTLQYCQLPSLGELTLEVAWWSTRHNVDKTGDGKLHMHLFSWSFKHFATNSNVKQLTVIGFGQCSDIVSRVNFMNLFICHSLINKIVFRLIVICLDCLLSFASDVIEPNNILLLYLGLINLII